MSRVICWFRQDLRLTDNPALYWASRAGDVLPIYIYDDRHAGDNDLGQASKAWLHHSLQSLNESLQGQLRVFKGDPQTILSALIEEHHIEEVYWNRCYEPWQVARDKAVKQNLAVAVHSYNGSLLWEPWDVLKKDGTPYKVFTPFFKHACHTKEPERPMSGIPDISYINNKVEDDGLESLNLLPSHDWHYGMMSHWSVGERAAQDVLKTFLCDGLAGYKDGRNIPAKAHTSRLSPYLHFGEISPNQVWYAAQERGQDKDVLHFQSELGWREFSYTLLYYFPSIPHANFNAQYDAFPWHDNDALLRLWQRGKTGYPIIDAGMRQLWKTGYMHNRVRMIVASFLVKNLGIHWKHGAAWFWDCLVDADLANNSASWQWVAGSGADAAPYFRIFNPILQSKKFDPEGAYIKTYVPELKSIPTKYIHAPWEAPEDVMADVNDAYPKPMVDFKESREMALDAYRKLKA